MQTLPFREIMKQRVKGSADVITAAVDLLMKRISSLRKRVTTGKVDIQASHS